MTALQRDFFERSVHDIAPELIGVTLRVGGVGGVVASLTSLRFSIVSGGLLCVVGTLVVAALFPALLRYDAKRDKLT